MTIRTRRLLVVLTALCLFGAGFLLCTAGPHTGPGPVGLSATAPVPTPPSAPARQGTRFFGLGPAEPVLHATPGTPRTDTARTATSILEVIPPAPALPRFSPADFAAPASVIHTPQPPAPESYEVMALVTGYCPCRRCCGRFANGRTSTRTSAWRPGAAADPTVIPYGSRVEVPGYGTVRVDDTGFAMRHSWRRRNRIHLDVRFTYHYQARNWGARWLQVRITPPAR